MPDWVSHSLPYDHMTLEGQCHFWCHSQSNWWEFNRLCSGSLQMRYDIIWQWVQCNTALFTLLLLCVLFGFGPLTLSMFLSDLSLLETTSTGEPMFVKADLSQTPLGYKYAEIDFITNTNLDDYQLSPLSLLYFSSAMDWFTSVSQTFWIQQLTDCLMWDRCVASSVFLQESVRSIMWNNFPIHFNSTKLWGRCGLFSQK